MPLSTTDTIKSGDGFTQLDAPAISVAFTISYTDNIVITIGYGPTPDAGVVQEVEVRLTAAQMEAFNDEFPSFLAPVRSTIEDYVKVYLQNLKPGIEITKT